MSSFEDSLFKFSKITRADFNIGAALFTLENMGALKRKLGRGEDDIVLAFIVEVVSAYLLQKNVEPPLPNWTPPVVQISGPPPRPAKFNPMEN